MRVERGNRGVEEGLRTCESRRTKGMNEGQRTGEEERRKNEERRWMNERRTGKVRVNANEKGERKWARRHTQTKTHGTTRHDAMRAAFWNTTRTQHRTRDRHQLYPRTRHSRQTRWTRHSRLHYWHAQRQPDADTKTKAGNDSGTCVRDADVYVTRAGRGRELGEWDEVDGLLAMAGRDGTGGDKEGGDEEDEEGGDEEDEEGGRWGYKLRRGCNKCEMRNAKRKRSEKRRR